MQDVKDFLSNMQSFLDLFYISYKLDDFYLQNNIFFLQDSQCMGHKMGRVDYDDNILNFQDPLCMDHMKHDFDSLNNIIWCQGLFYNNHNYYDLCVNYSKN
jgi:hypothetical protein